MFAIAVTLLVLEVRVPHVAPEESLWQALGQAWPSYFGFGLSFVVIGIMWINHHGIFKDIERTDHTLLVLNLLLLLTISFVPFSTAVFADYLRDADHRLPATLLYGGSFTVNAVFFNALWLYASRGRRLMDAHVSDARLASRTARYRLGPLIYGATLPLALISPWLSLAVYVVTALFYLLPLAE